MKTPKHLQCAGFDALDKIAFSLATIPNGVVTIQEGIDRLILLTMKVLIFYHRSKSCFVAELRVAHAQARQNVSDGLETTTTNYSAVVNLVG